MFFYGTFLYLYICYHNRTNNRMIIGKYVRYKMNMNLISNIINNDLNIYLTTFNLREIKSTETKLSVVKIYLKYWISFRCFVGNVVKVNFPSFNKKWRYTTSYFLRMDFFLLLISMIRKINNLYIIESNKEIFFVQLIMPV